MLREGDDNLDFAVFDVQFIIFIALQSHRQKIFIIHFFQPLIKAKGFQVFECQWTIFAYFNPNTGIGQIQKIDFIEILKIINWVYHYATAPLNGPDCATKNKGIKQIMSTSMI